MACATVFDAFAVTTEHFRDEVYRRASFRDPWMNLIPSGIFTPHKGLTHTGFTILKQEPTNEERAGDAIALTTGSNAGSCANTWQQVSLGYSQFQYSPVQLNWKGHVFCKDDAYFEHAPDEFLSAYVEEMAEYVRKDLNNHFLYHYSRRVPIYPAVATFGEGTVNASATLTAAAATKELTQAMLDRLAVRLIYDRATNPDGRGFIEMGTSGPLFTLLIGMEASHTIKKNNQEFRTDLRYGSPDSLLARLGAQESIKNFKHLPNPLPPRYTHDGTKYVRVATFVEAAGTKGVGTDVNPDYINPVTAPYEAAVVLSPYVMTSEKIAPSSQVGPVNFDPANYAGEWMWVTGNDALSETDGDGCQSDPLHKRGRHYAQYRHALRPGSNVRSGALIMFKRCASALGTDGDCPA